jgi:hypothetical protein
MMQTFYGRNDTESRVWTLESDDNGVTCGNPRTVVSGDIVNPVTEASICAVKSDGTDAGTKIIGIVRRDNDATPLQVHSSDGGVSWVNDGALPFGVVKDHAPFVISTNFETGAFDYISTDRTSWNIPVRSNTYDNAVSNVSSYSGKRVIYNPDIPGYGFRSDDNRGNFGYPSAVKVGPSRSDIIVMMHDFAFDQPFPIVDNKIWVDVLMMRLYPVPQLIAKAPAQSVPNAVFYKLNYNVRLDTAGMLSGSGTNIVIPQDGYYAITVGCPFQGSAAGTFREMSIRIYDPYANTTSAVVYQRLPPSSVTQMNTMRISHSQFFKRGMVLVIGLGHDAGVALNTLDTTFDSGIEIVRIA